MAKTTPGLQAALKAVKALQKSQNREANADYSVALSASKAGQASLRAMTGRIEGQALRSAIASKRTVAGLTRAQRAEQRNVREAIAGTTNRYGSALGASVAGSYAVAGATAKAGTQILAGQKGIAQKGVALQQMLANTAAAGVSAQGAAAKYALAQALQQRSIVDSQTIAQLTGDLYQTAIEQNNAWTLWKKQQDYAARQAEKAANAEERDIVKETVRVLGSGGGDLAAWVDDIRTGAIQAGDNIIDSKGQFNITAAVDEYANANGLDPANPQDAALLSVLRGTLRGANQGLSTDEAAQGAMDYLYGGMAGWDRVSPHLFEQVSAGTTMASNQRAAAAVNTNQVTDEDRQWFANWVTANAASKQYGDILLAGATDVQREMAQQYTLTGAAPASASESGSSWLSQGNSSGSSTGYSRKV